MPEAPLSEWSESFRLPRCGKMVRLREPSVDDLLKAQRAVGKDAPANAEAVALAAGMAEIDGRVAVYETIKTLKLRDFGEIMKRARKLGFLEDPDSTDAP
ncbi:MAG: hypothetical protein ACREEU_10425 [Acetobacteraceae bacterium]